MTRLMAGGSGYVGGPGPILDPVLLNHERMPVLLATEGDHEAWQEALALVRPFPPEHMRIVQTGYDKRDRLEGADTTL
jgi:putative SOS response-associated peptidase YedK